MEEKLDVLLEEEKEEFADEVTKRTGKILSKDDPCLMFWEVMADWHTRFVQELKNDSYIRVTEALLAQKKFLEGYQKEIDREYERNLTFLTTNARDAFTRDMAVEVKRIHDAYYSQLNSLFGMYDDHLKSLKNLTRIVVVLIVFATIAIGGLLGLLAKLFLLLP